MTRFVLAGFAHSTKNVVLVRWNLRELFGGLAERDRNVNPTIEKMTSSH